MAKCEILKREGTLCLVKVGWDYHIIDWFEDIDVVCGAHPGEKPKHLKKEPFKEAKGFNSESIRAVSKDRRESTARNYFSELVRLRQKQIKVFDEEYFPW